MHGSTLRLGKGIPDFRERRAGACKCEESSRFSTLGLPGEAGVLLDRQVLLLRGPNIRLRREWLNLPPRDGQHPLQTLERSPRLMSKDVSAKYVAYVITLMVDRKAAMRLTGSHD